jgi:cytoskeletal protein CcmA (bactofilin family)
MAKLQHFFSKLLLAVILVPMSALLALPAQSVSADVTEPSPAYTIIYDMDGNYLTTDPDADAAHKMPTRPTSNPNLGGGFVYGSALGKTEDGDITERIEVEGGTFAKIIGAPADIAGSKLGGYSDIWFSGNTIINGDLIIPRASSFTTVDGTLTVNGQVTGASQLYLYGSLTVNGDIAGASEVYLYGSLTVNGVIDAGSVTVRDGSSLYVYAGDRVAIQANGFTFYEVKNMILQSTNRAYDPAITTAWHDMYSYSWVANYQNANPGAELSGSEVPIPATNNGQPLRYLKLKNESHTPYYSFTASDLTGVAGTYTSSQLTPDKLYTTTSNGPVSITYTNADVTTPIAYTGQALPAGDYQFHITQQADVENWIDAGETTADVTITRESLSASDFTVDLSGKTYDGSGLQPGVTATDSSRNILINHVTYFDSSGNEVAAPTDAGVYTVKVWTNQNEYYTSVAGLNLGTFTISPASVGQNIFSVDLSDRAYTGLPVWPNVTADGVKIDHVAYFDEQGNQVANPINVGTYTVKVWTVAGNYEAVAGLSLGTFRIVPAGAAATVMPGLVTPAAVGLLNIGATSNVSAPSGQNPETPAGSDTDGHGSEEVTGDRTMAQKQANNQFNWGWLAFGLLFLMMLIYMFLRWSEVGRKRHMIKK